MVIIPRKASTSGVKTMLLLTGEYEHIVDGKNRILISNKLRSQIDAEEQGSNFYLVLGANGILCLYPEKHFEQVVLAASAQSTPADEAVAFERMSFALACKVELDGQGRLLLNEKLRKRAQLRARVTLVGVRDHVELWNSETWQEYLTNNMAQYQKQMAQARKVVLQKENKTL